MKIDAWKTQEDSIMNDLWPELLIPVLFTTNITIGEEPVNGTVS